MAIVHKAQVFSCVPRNYSLVLTISLEQNACGEYLLHQKRNSSTWFLASSTSGFFFSLKDWVFLKFEFVSPELRDSEFSVWQSEVSRTRKKEWPVSQRGNSNSSSVTGVTVCKTNLVNRFFFPSSFCLSPPWKAVAPLCGRLSTALSQNKIGQIIQGHHYIHRELHICGEIMG